MIYIWLSKENVLRQYIIIACFILLQLSTKIFHVNLDICSHWKYIKIWASLQHLRKKLLGEPTNDKLSTMKSAITTEYGGY